MTFRTEEGDEFINELQKLDFKLEARNGYDPNRIFGNLALRPKMRGMRIKSAPLYARCSYVESSTVDSIILKFKIGAYLRFNLIKVFGYILHRKNIELNTAYYTSLYIILTCIKLNHVDVLSMISVLKDIGYAKPNEQFIKIFESMEKHLPPYLRCSATYWKEGIQTKTINMDNILMPYGDNTVVVNILDGLIPEEIEALSEEEVTTEAKTEEEQKILYNFNVNVLQLIRHIKNQTQFKITPWLFAGLLQLFPRTLIQPDVEESIQLLTYYFYEKEDQINEKTEIEHDKREPYKMIRHVLQELLNSVNTEDVIKDAADTVLRNLKPRSPTAVNPHYSSFTFFIHPESIKIDEMLKYVSRCTFPLEIILAAERVRYYIDVKIIGYFTIMDNFNPYLYSSPMEVLIAILDRIMRRESSLTSEVLNAVGAVYSYLIFKYRYSTMPIVYPTEMVNINILFMGMKAPDIPRDIRGYVDDLLGLLMMEPLKYSELLIKKVPVYKCTTPVICFYYLLEELSKNKDIIGGDIENIIIQLRNCTCNVGKCPIIEKPEDDDVFPVGIWIKIVQEWKEPNIACGSECTITSKTTTVATTRMMKTSTTTIRTTTVTTQPPPTSPSEGPNETQSTLEQTEPTTPTAPPSLLGYPTPIVILPELVTETVPTDDELIDKYMKNITEEFGRDISLDKEQLKEILDILTKHEKDIKLLKDQHVLVISFYVTFLEKISMKHNSTLFKEWWHMWKRNKDIVTVFLENMETNMTQPILGELIIALPPPENENEKKMFITIKEILARQELFIYIDKYIKKGDQMTTGTLLKAVIREEVKLTDKLKKNEIEALKYYQDKIQEKGFGKRKISYGIIRELLTLTVSISNVMDNALDFDRLENENKQAFNKIVRFLNSNRIILQSWNTWYLHTTCGAFTQSLFKLLLNTPSVDNDIRDAVHALTPLINLDKNGHKPAFLRNGQGFASKTRTKK
ncbi:hypothetical protein ILUMI_04525 [Ignelater luminosus]|uniref:Uncharacterized protein n=1 Tax=Ignelater luminosus TaxID=2038154 RepID=A0A8K0DJK9_IGNLU|nr:hypothetical protein ILUMI_04525 [Ignelater luminosus]